jgi:hypothetical protein
LGSLRITSRLGRTTSSLRCWCCGFSYSHPTDLYAHFYPCADRRASVPPLLKRCKRLAVSTGKLRALLHFHIRPIDPVVFREPLYRSTGNVILRRVSRLYALSVYPGRTWLPSNAPSGTTRTPEVRPFQSSRTRKKTAHVSCAHDRLFKPVIPPLF